MAAISEIRQCQKWGGAMRGVQLEAEGGREGVLSHCQCHSQSMIKLRVGAFRFLFSEFSLPLNADSHRVGLIPIVIVQVPPDAVERAAGLLFFDRLDRKRLKRINGGPKTGT